MDDTKLTLLDDDHVNRVKEKLLIAVNEELAIQDVSPATLLAIMASVTGYVLAYQDEEMYTRPQLIHMVNVNVINGNQQAVTNQQKAKMN